MERQPATYLSGAMVATILAAWIGPVAAQQPGQIPIRVGGPVAAPVKTKDVRPIYPPQAQQARVQGVVILEITVDTDGTVKDPVILRSIPLLDQAALDAVRQWEYQPVLLNGSPVPVRMTTTVNFVLNGPDAASGFVTTMSSSVNAVPGVVSSGTGVSWSSGGVSGGVVGGVVGGAVYGTPPPNPRHFTYRSGRPDGTVDVWELTEERTAALPAWDPQSAPEPPVSLGTAVTNARFWLQQRYPEVERFQLLSANLNRSFATWFYQMRFQPDPARPFAGGMYMALVLMDGSVLEPRNEPQRR